MRSHDEILRIYKDHVGNSHEAGLFAVFAAGVEDGRAVRDVLDEPKAKQPSPIKLDPVVSTSVAPVATKPLIKAPPMGVPKPPAVTTGTATRTFFDRPVEAGTSTSPPITDKYRPL